MQGKVYLKHKIQGKSDGYILTGDLRWYSNNVIRVFTPTCTWEIPVDNVCAIQFGYTALKEVKISEEKSQG